MDLCYALSAWYLICKWESKVERDFFYDISSKMSWRKVGKHKWNSWMWGQKFLLLGSLRSWSYYLPVCTWWKGCFGAALFVQNSHKASIATKGLPVSVLLVMWNQRKGKLPLCYLAPCLLEWNVWFWSAVENQVQGLSLSGIVSFYLFFIFHFYI